jgi:hypothetical protein
MGMRVDDSRGDERTRCVDDCFTVRNQVLSDLNDHAIANPDIGVVRGCAGSVDDGASRDQQIRHDSPCVLVESISRNS